MYPRFNFTYAAIAALLLAAAGIVLAVFWVPSALSDATRSDQVSALTQTIGLIAAIGAALAAFFTVFQVQSENRRQREMETLHLLNEQYEKIFDDIYALRAELLRNVLFSGDAK
ncbi:MAG: hypothetical protein AB7T08_00225 [Hyphomonadaceae bacterium]